MHSLPSVIFFSFCLHACNRQWFWGDANDTEDHPIELCKYHLFSQRDTLKSVAQANETSIKDILRWNGINDVKEIYHGMRLIVRKTVLSKNGLKIPIEDSKKDLSTESKETVSHAVPTKIESTTNRQSTSASLLSHTSKTGDTFRQENAEANEKFAQRLEDIAAFVSPTKDDTAIKKRYVYYTNTI